MQYISLVLSSLLLVSCVNKEAKVEEKRLVTPINFKIEKKVTLEKEIISELKTISQDITFYTKDMLFTDINTSQSSYEKNYFYVWNLEKIDISLDEAMWAHKSYLSENSYGENLQKREESFFDNLLENSNYKEFASLNKNALTLQRVNLRGMPSDKPILLDPSKAGEGFPFDYLQNSSIAPNKPLLLSHYSKDKEWAFVESSFAYGWVKSKDIVTISKQYTKEWQKAKQIFLIKDNVALYSLKNDFLFKSQIGMMLALVSEDEESYTVLAVQKDKNFKALFLQVRLPKSISHKERLLFNTQNINTILGEISKSKYGWGGIYEQRDCSSTLRDFYAPFGVWLPRNSYKQSLSGEVISLENLKIEEKQSIIKERGVPFKTLLYKRGHIGLYVGTFNDKVIFYQNIWGVKTLKDNKEGRFIIGKPIFSTLEVGSNLQNFDKNSSMLKNLKSMTKL